MCLSAGWLLSQVRAAEPTSTALNPVVEAEEEVYAFEPANNGADPLWCGGSTCLVRAGDVCYASGLETLKNAKPLNNCRWTLFRGDSKGWRQINRDDQGRTREPSPLAVFDDGRFFLSANPTLNTDADAYSGPARPEILQMSTRAEKPAPEILRPGWSGSPKFTEHSYRSFAADGPSNELILFQNIDYTHAEWAFMERQGRWSAQGQLKWPWGAEYDKPQPIRVCYPNVALKNRAVHFCGVSDVVEPYQAWREYKKQLTGREWDYDFRRLFYTWTPDITTQPFKPWVEIASRDKTCGWVSPGDLWVAPDGSVHVLWMERAIDERLREKYFPQARQSHSLNYAKVREGQVTFRRVLAVAEEGGSSEIPSAGRFQITPDNRLFVVYYMSGKNRAGKGVSENRLLEIKTDGSVSTPVTLPLKYPLSRYFTATVRGGSPPSKYLDMLGQRAGGGSAICYARVRLGDAGLKN